MSERFISKPTKIPPPLRTSETTIANFFTEFNTSELDLGAKSPIKSSFLRKPYGPDLILSRSIRLHGNRNPLRNAHGRREGSIRDSEIDVVIKGYNFLGPNRRPEVMLCQCAILSSTIESLPIRVKRILQAT